MEKKIKVNDYAIGNWDGYEYIVKVRARKDNSYYVLILSKLDKPNELWPESSVNIKNKRWVLVTDDPANSIKKANKKQREIGEKLWKHIKRMELVKAI